ncbi:MAG TPA: hypothetical protein VJN18_10725 [Polyangiaceae bacterium]|nr:hypothetical protein [Polyangiaceae bacterium]
MSELSARTRKLLRAAREDFEPEQGDRLRLERRLALQLGVAAGVTAAGSGAAAATAGSGVGAASLGAFTSIKWVSIKWTAGVLLTIGATAGGVGAYRVRAASPALPAAAARAAPAIVKKPLAAAGAVEPRGAQSTVQLDPAPLSEVQTDNNAAAPTTIASPARSSAASRTSVADEARLIRSADAAVRRGDTDRALALLEQHSRAYPSGVLAEERAAQRVFALCRAGRTRDAHTEAKRFLRSNPRSHFAGSIRQACAETKKE